MSKTRIGLARTLLIGACVGVAAAGCGRSAPDTYYIVKGDAPYEVTAQVGDELQDAPRKKCAQLRRRLEALVLDIDEAWDEVLRAKARYDAGSMTDVTAFNDPWVGRFEATKWELNTMKTCPEFTTARAVAIRTWRDVGRFQNNFVAQAMTRDPLPGVSAGTVEYDFRELRGLLEIEPAK